MELDEIKIIEVSESKQSSSIHIKSKRGGSHMTSFKGSIVSVNKNQNH